MNSDEAVERLPRLVGGGLDIKEADDVRAHVAGCPASQAALDDTRRAAEVFDAHLPASILVDLAWDRPAAVPDVPADVAERHLSSCAECAEELALLRESRELERASDLVRPGATAPARSRVSRFAGWGGALAAGLVLGLGVSTLRQDGPPGASPTPDAGVQAELNTLRESNAALQLQLDRAAAPQVNVPVVELFPDQARRSVGEAGQEVVVPASARVLALLLSAEGATGRVASVELHDAAGRIVWSGSGLSAGPLGAYSLAVPAALLPDGRYVIVVEPQGGRALRYPLRVRHAK